MLVIERLCSRFHLVARQLRLRRGNRETLRVEDEADVQDLLRALLVLDHEDIRPIAWTPEYAGGTPRADFLLKLEQVVIEARLARGGWQAAELRQELAVDIRAHTQLPDCKTLVCFVYDPEGRIANPRAIEEELSGDRDGLAVRVIIAPQGSDRSPTAKNPSP
jgi:hypothetical protein